MNIQNLPAKNEFHSKIIISIRGNFHKTNRAASLVGEIAGLAAYFRIRFSNFIWTGRFR